VALACARLACLSEGNLEGPATSVKQKIALFTIWLWKMDRHRDSRERRQHLYGLDGDEAADILVLRPQPFC